MRFQGLQACQSDHAYTSLETYFDLTSIHENLAPLFRDDVKYSSRSLFMVETDQLDTVSLVVSNNEVGCL